jgi:hypothetical protein
MKLRGGKARAAYSHLKYLQREGAGVERSEENGDLKLTETRGELYGPDRHRGVFIISSISSLLRGGSLRD